MSTVMNRIDRTVTADHVFCCLLSSSSSSASIGKNSDDDEAGEIEVESPYKGPLDMMESLEEALPIRRGISKFYKGKSKSFTSLPETEASLQSVKELAKPENPYSRRRRNLFSPRVCSRGGISKKPVKSAFNMAVTAMSQREGDSSSSGDDSPPRKHHMNLPPRQSKGSFGNCVPVFQTAAGRNIHNLIC